MARLALSIDLERCTGCKSCEAACKQHNGLGPHAYRNRVLWFDSADAAGPSLDFLTVTCQQCARPACLRACPLDPPALGKGPGDGVVALDPARCTGCGECALACPYGAMGYDPVGGRAVKCDLCAPRRAAGEGPACAAACPTRAIRFGPREALVEAAQRAGRQLRDHDHFLQGPATLYLEPLSGRWPAADTPVQPLIADHRPRARLGGAAVQRPYRGAAAQGKRRVESGACHICFNACSLRFELRGESIERIEGHPEDPVFGGRVCPKSQLMLQHYHSAHRLLRPRVRVGPRGGGRWREVSWSQALDDIAERLLALRAQHGPQTLAIHAGTRTGLLNILGFMPLFARLWGTANTATTESFCDAGKVVALAITQGSTLLSNTYTADDIGSAGLYLYIGDNQAETRPVNFGLVNDWRLRRGVPMVVVDPRRTVTASKADRWLAIRPGTDMALGLAMVHHLFASEAFNRGFCERWLAGWRAWRDFIAAQGYTPEWAAPLTGIAAGDIRWLAEAIAAADGAMIFVSRGINQHVNSTQTNRVFMFLAAMTGNWARRGGGYFNVAAEPDWAPLPLADHAPQPSPPPAHSSNPAAWVTAMGADHGVEAPITALISGNNPATQWPDQRAVRAALGRLDLLVHLECFPNETSHLADYVLPMASGIEKGGPTRLAEDRRLGWTDPLIAPPGEARSDHWFWIELGARLGFAEHLPERWCDPGTFWEEAFRPANPDLRGATLARLRATPHRWLRLPLADEAAPERPLLYPEPADGGRRFPTPSGRLEFHTEALERRFAAIGMSALPRFYTDPQPGAPGPVPRPRGAPLRSPFFAKGVLQTPVDWVAGSAADPDYPLALITGRPPAPHFHSWTHWLWQAQEMWPQAYAQLHPEQARAAGVADGEWLRVESPRGSITVRAWVSAGIRPGALYLPFGWGEQQPWHPAQTANQLTELATDPVSQQPNLKWHRCRVRRARRGG